MTVAVLVLAGGALGAPLRYLLGKWIPTAFPWGILIANVSASFVLGLAGAGVTTGWLPGWVLALAGTGFCGTLSTYSSFTNDTLKLAEKGEHRSAALNLVVTVGCGMIAAVAGAALGRAI
ncbi:putative fluoride ion transporter CrcB 2 [Streptosporangium violaceochromogenes]|nr:putative fluoride ion transporter CrcB 2 [Streptosporangium violaceochromogenes]